MREKAVEAFTIRNQIREEAQRMMIKGFENLPGPSSWQYIAGKYYDLGFRGDALYQAIINGSMRSNQGVDRALGIIK
jgi:hypothetical protein